MESEGNEQMVWTVCSCSASDFNFLYAGIGCCSASNNLKCMHFKENKGNEDLKTKDLYEGGKRYVYLVKESIAGLVLHVGLVHHKLVYTKSILVLNGCETHSICLPSNGLAPRSCRFWWLLFILRIWYMSTSALLSALRLSKIALCLKQSEYRHNACRYIKASWAGGKRTSLERCSLSIGIRN